MTRAWDASGWTSNNGKTSDNTACFLDATGNPNEYQGTFDDADGTHTLTVTVDGNRVAWTTASPGAYQSKGTGTFVNDAYTGTVLGTFAGKSLKPSEPDGRALGKFYARFVADPVHQIIVGSPGAWVYSGARFTIPILLDVGAQVLGSYSLKIDFNPDVATIVEVTGGGAAEFSGAPTVNMDNKNGFVTLTAFQAGTTSPKGIVHVADLTFDVVGLPGDETTLAIDTGWEHYDIGDPDFNPITLTPGNGIVTVAPVRVDVGTVVPMSVMSQYTLDVPIRIDWGLNQVIGSYDVTLSFDPSVFEATTVAGGTSPEFSGTPTFNIDNTLGTVSFNAFNSSTTSPKGFADIARVTLSTIGDLDAESVVGLELKDLMNPDAGFMGSYVEAAKVIVSTGLCGDVNENDRIDIGDAMFIAQWLVGNRDSSALNLDVGDTNVNGRVDVGRCHVHRPVPGG